MATSELGTDTELMDLVSKIKGFDFDYATTRENMALSQALKVVAADIVQRHAQVVQLQQQLEEKLAMASVTAELSGVINIIRPRKRGWFK
jgi:hypothetical protein